MKKIYLSWHITHKQLYIGCIYVFIVLFVASIIMVVTGLLQVHIAFTLAAFGIIISGVLPVKDMYDGVDWSVIVLLGAMIPVGTALDKTGGAEQIASLLIRVCP